MNYRKIYETLIDRAKHRPDLIGYTETHHITPKCMGGSNDPENLVVLTPEEHYLAHLLLTKIYPGNIKLSFAAVKMTAKTKTRKSSRNNKLYGWLKRNHSKNITLSQTGKVYYNNGSKNIKLFPGETVPEGFVKGRSYSPTSGKSLNYKSDNFKDSGLQKQLAKRRWDREQQKLISNFGCTTFEEALKVFGEFRSRQHYRFWIKPTLKEFPFLTKATARRLNELLN